VFDFAGFSEVLKDAFAIRDARGLCPF
jgi:hypothetical protein